MKTRVLITSVWWSRDSEDIQLFEDEQAIQDHFINSNGWADTTILSYSNNIDLAISYIDPLKRDIVDFLKLNYAVIEYDKGDGTTPTYRCYFADIIHNSGYQYTITLELDDITTNYTSFRNNVNNESYILRSHVNTLYENDSQRYMIDSVLDNSLLLTRECDELAKRPTITHDIELDYVNRADFNKFLNEQVKYWLYVFIDKSKEYKCYKFNEVATENLVPLYGFQGEIRTERSSREVGCMCVPIFNDDRCKLRISHEGDLGFVEINKEGLESFFRINKGTGFAYSMKLSKIPPFVAKKGLDVNYIIENEFTFELESKGKALTTIDINELGRSRDLCECVCTTILGTPEGIIFGAFDPDTIESYTLSLDELFGIERDFIKMPRPVHEGKYNPKLLSGDFKELRLIGPSGSYYSYDILKLNSTFIKFQLSQPLTPTITKSYCRVIPASESLYIEDNNKVYQGLIESLDTSIMFTNDRYDEYLSNNKNFNIMNGLDITKGLSSSIVASGVAMAVSGMNPIVGATAIAGSIGSAVSQGINTTLAIDNMKSAPDILKGTNDPYLLIKCNNLDYKLVLYECYDNDYETQDNKMNYNGYIINRYGILSQYDNTRNIFNYIRADLPPLLITEKMSNIEWMRLRAKLLEGVRFWHKQPEQEDYFYENTQRRY